MALKKKKMNPLALPESEDEEEEVELDDEEGTTEEIEKQIDKLKEKKPVAPIQQRIVYVTDSEAIRQILVDVQNIGIAVNEIQNKLKEFEKD